MEKRGKKGKWDDDFFGGDSIESGVRRIEIGVRLMDNMNIDTNRESNLHLLVIPECGAIIEARKHISEKSHENTIKHFCGMNKVIQQKQCNDMIIMYIMQNKKAIN